ncbi:hypothetical protein EJ04DRAFT_189384 [Polyplosphaeria fusca]|uniref:Xylanolytic transcriptional activator regulatory domain-containing protein n=1 Tax=Polyplosphaeria fusca TaxID=682080 RepID=A0A9P4QXS3_9PLEO|nr:hypothetical protein EJ04DRAFT_189384 [Polyplosphaeria fusca]
MSSIKQVQDLQSQLAELKQENTQLRTKATVRGADADREQAPVVRQIDPHGPGLDIRKLPAPSLTNFDHVRRNIQVHSHNIFKTPATSTATSHSNVGALDLPDIPARADFAYLSQAYFESTHELYPVLHWPTFKREVDQVYTSRSFQGMSSDWIALFFTVLACGSLQASMVAPGSPKGPDAGIKYFETATRLLVSWIQDFSLNYARAAFILSVFAMEGNKKSAGSVWLATAIRAAQELGLNLDTDHHPRFESEMGRRLWWALYVRDRITSLGANCSMLINEDDCKLPLPSSTDDRYVESPTSPRRSAAYSPFVCVIHVTRLFSELYQVLKASIIKPHVFQNYDEKFHSSFAVLPEPYHPRSESYLDPSGLSAVLALQFARYQLYRRNMSPVCTSAERSEALHRCASAAQETAKYISRTRKGPNPNAEVERNWRNKVAQIASNMICMHLWRCIMMLCLQGDYYAASSCCLLSSTIGDIREINTACGKNLVFFLDRLVENRRSGSGGMHHLEHDEEMLAYVSGDMQGNLEHSWVWAGGDLAPSQTSPHTSPHGRNRTLGADEPMQGIHLPLRSNLGSSESGTREWEGWSRIERTIRHLMEESRPRPSSYYPTPHNPVKRVQLAPEVPTSPSRSGPAPSPTPSSTSRISIANII